MAMRPVSVPRDVEVIHKTSMNVFLRLAAAHLALSHIHKLSASDGAGVGEGILLIFFYFSQL